MTILTIKIMAGLGILAIGVIGGLIPLSVAERETRRRFFSLGNALAGGIFLGVGLMHLLPEANETLQGFYDYPLAALIAAMGMVLLLWVDRVLFEAVYSGADASGQERPRRVPVYPLVLLIALSIHSLVAGIALGLEPEVATSLLVMIGILLHKGSAAFALVVSAHVAGKTARELGRLLWVFVLMTPLGIALGTLASGIFEGRAADLGAGVFNALAAGTFIYIAILDVIGAEMSTAKDRMARVASSALADEDDMTVSAKDRDRLPKFVLVVVGLGGMAILGLWV